jgi:hypothetical protein
MEKVLPGGGCSDRASIVPYEYGAFEGTDSVVAPRAEPFGPYPNNNHMPYFDEGFKPPVHLVPQVTSELRVGNLKYQSRDYCNEHIKNSANKQTRRKESANE